ncbi:MAG: cache domain-containing protein [Sporomusaceae bacterium]|nr:cache domain-containing protein [Sporomusaceae bacterium]
MSLRIKLFLTTAVTLVLFIWLFSLAITHQVEKRVLEDVTQTMDSKTRQAAMTIDFWFRERSLSLEAFASELERHKLDQKSPELRENMISFSRRFSDRFANSLFIGFANHQLVSIVNRSQQQLAAFDPTVRPWYQQALAQRRTIITEPYNDFFSGRQVVTLAVPVKELSEPAVLSTDIFLEELKPIADKIRFHPLAQIAFFSREGKVIYDPDGIFAATPDESILIAADRDTRYKTLQTMFAQESGFLYDSGGQGYQVFHTYVPSTGWVIMTRIPSAVFYEASRQLQQYAIGASVLAILLALIFSSIFVRRIVLPLEEMAQVAHTMGGGNLNVAFSPQKTPELKNLALCLESMRNQILSLLDGKDEMVKEANANRQEIQSLYQQMIALNAELNKAFQEKDAANLATIKALADAVEAKDSYTRGHSERVLEYSLMIGKKMKLSEAQMEFLSYAAILHDIGKIGIPFKILNKPGKLSADEYSVIQQHPQIGYKIIKNISYLREVGEAVVQHHEWFNGQGYPSGLSDRDIHPMAQILAVADAYDAMTSLRVYRKSLSREQACAELRSKAGIQFSPNIVKTFCEVLEQEGEQSSAAIS